MHDDDKDEDGLNAEPNPSDLTGSAGLLDDDFDDEAAIPPEIEGADDEPELNETEDEESLDKLIDEEDADVDQHDDIDLL